MTNKEIEERLKALPYEVPSDISPGAISVLMTAVEAETGTDAKEVEEKFWKHLHQLSPEEQEEFFESARKTRESLSGVGTSIIIAVLVLIIIWVLF